MTGDELDPLAAVRADAARLDALAAGTARLDALAAGTARLDALAAGTARLDPTSAADDDPALALLVALRAEVDAAVSDRDGPALRRDAALLDALAAGLSGPRSADPAIELLQALRAAVDDVTLEPALAAVVPLVDPHRPGRHRRRILRTGVAAGSVALALSMSGVAAAAYDSHPGGTLYGLRTQTFGRTDDDPVAAQEVLADLRRQTAAAVTSPADPTVVARARADLSKLRHYISAEHDPVAQKSIAASASTVVTTLAKLPAPVATRGATAHPSASDLTGRRAAPDVSGRPGAPSASARGSATPAGSPGASSTPREPDASPAADPSTSPSDGASTSDAPSGSPSASTSPSGPPTTGSPDPTPTGTPTGTPSTTPSGPASATPSPTVTVPPSVATRPATPVAKAKPKKTVKKKKVVATLMTAQLPASGLPPR